MMEKVLGIHRDKLLPNFAEESFEAWLKRNPLPPAPARPAPKVSLFPTGFVNYYKPGPGRGGGARQEQLRGQMPEAKLLRDACT